MNERIRKLAEKAFPNVKYWNEEIQNGSTPPKNYAITPEELEKFANLIVWECANNVGVDSHISPVQLTDHGVQLGKNLLENFGIDKHEFVNKQMWK